MRPLGVEPRELTVFPLTEARVFLAVALIATALLAWKAASRVEPIAALRLVVRVALTRISTTL